jgi:hypothetical protein
VNGQFGAEPRTSFDVPGLAVAADWRAESVKGGKAGKIEDGLPFVDTFRSLFAAPPAEMRLLFGRLQKFGTVV